MIFPPTDDDLRAVISPLGGPHPCLLFRALPWTFPRACCDDPGPVRVIEVQTTDLLLSCPTWSCTAPEPFPLRRAMREFRERWSRRKVIVAAPQPPDYGDGMVALAYWGCNADLVWRVDGPPEFLLELRKTIDGPREHPDELPARLRPPERPKSLNLCCHEILGD